jgi:RNA polymerase sigma-70 factor (ECF subfamily)
VDEAAELLGCPSGTVKSRCARARAKLLPLLHDLRGDDGNQEPSRPVVSAGDLHTQGRGGEQS